MFGNNDKITLTLINPRDINGKLLRTSKELNLNRNREIRLNTSIELPLNDYKLDFLQFDLSKYLSAIDVFEYNEGLTNGGAVIFSIYIGKVSTISEIIKEGNVEIKENVKIESVDSPICVQNISGKKIVFATLKEQDIVVENQEQLMEIIKQLSDSFKTVKDSVTKVRTLSKINRFKK